MRARPEREFYFRLAGHLGYTVGELLARVDSRELTEWRAYEQLTGPLGGKRVDTAAAIVASAVANKNSKRKVKPDKFVPDWAAASRRAMSPEAMWQKVVAMNSRMGGRVEK